MILEITLFVAFGVSLALLFWWGATRQRGSRMRKIMRETRALLNQKLSDRHRIAAELAGLAREKGMTEDVVYELSEARLNAVRNLDDWKSGYQEERLLTECLMRFRVIADRNEHLGRSEMYDFLMNTLDAINDDIIKLERDHNGNVRDWNNMHDMFPAKLVVDGKKAKYCKALTHLESS